MLRCREKFAVEKCVEMSETHVEMSETHSSSCPGGYEDLSIFP